MANFPSCGLEHSNFASQCDNTIELKWQILLQLLPQFITYCNSKTTIQICSYRVMVETKWYRLFCSISSGSLDDTNLRSDRVPLKDAWARIEAHGRELRCMGAHGAAGTRTAANGHARRRMETNWSALARTTHDGERTRSTRKGLQSPDADNELE